MLGGVLAGLGAGSLWGLTFIAPRAIRPFTELDLALGRYAVFGLFSLALMVIPRFRSRNLSIRRFRLAVFLGGVGYVGYYIFAAYAIKLAGSTIPPLVVGALPIALAIIGNWQTRQVKWSALAIPLTMIVIGLLIVNAASIASAKSAKAQIEVILGTVSAFLAFVIWIFYGVVNSKVMLADDAPDALVWTGLQGIGAMICVLPLVPVTYFTGATALPGHALTSPEGLNFILWCLVLGIAGSWFATWLWIIASARLPLALSAQLIVSETIFALLYGFAYDRRWPLTSEWLGSGILILGVLIGVNVFRREKSIEAVG